MLNVSSQAYFAIMTSVAFITASTSSPTFMPKSSDPSVKAIDAKPGDILRIIRKSPTAGIHIAYRYVVE